MKSSEDKLNERLDTIAIKENVIFSEEVIQKLQGNWIVGEMGSIDINGKQVMWYQDVEGSDEDLINIEINYINSMANLKTDKKYAYFHFIYINMVLAGKTQENNRELYLLADFVDEDIIILSNVDEFVVYQLKRK
jgi:hypothetical protein